MTLVRMIATGSACAWTGDWDPIDKLAQAAGAMPSGVSGRLGYELQGAFEKATRAAGGTVEYRTVPGSDGSAPYLP